NKLHLKYVVAIRSNHKAWLNKEEVTYSDWQTFDRVFSNGNEQTRYIQEIICPGSGEVRYWKITSDFFRERKSNTWYLMTNISGDLYSSIGNHYGFRNWIEYGLKPAKNVTAHRNCVAVLPMEAQNPVMSKRSKDLSQIGKNRV
ncbi:hypothetical protein QUB05_32960, partial [Microcoleus sp. F10-C6]